MIKVLTSTQGIPPRAHGRDRGFGPHCGLPYYPVKVWLSPASRQVPGTVRSPLSALALTSAGLLHDQHLHIDNTSGTSQICPLASARWRAYWQAAAAGWIIEECYQTWAVTRNATG